MRPRQYVGIFRRIKHLRRVNGTGGRAHSRSALSPHEVLSRGARHLVADTSLRDTSLGAQHLADLRVALGCAPPLPGDRPPVMLRPIRVLLPLVVAGCASAPPAT